jgi:hypothetical protein
VPGGGYVSSYAQAIRLLYERPAASYVFDNAALVIAERVRDTIEEWKIVDQWGAGFAQWVGKLDGLFGTICVALHLSGAAFDSILGAARDAGLTISEETALKAERIIEEFIIPSGVCFYSSMIGGFQDIPLALASFILTSTKDRFVISDFTIGVRALRGLDAFTVSKHVSVLNAGGWLTEEKGNRHATSWIVTPGLRQYFTERRERERARKGAIQEKIMAAGKERRQQNEVGRGLQHDAHVSAFNAASFKNAEAPF